MSEVPLYRARGQCAVSRGFDLGDDHLSVADHLQTQIITQNRGFQSCTDRYSKHFRNNYPAKM